MDLAAAGQSEAAAGHLVCAGQSARFRPHAAASRRSRSTRIFRRATKRIRARGSSRSANGAAGRVELVQIPAPDETNDNIVAYWVPDRAAAPKQPIDLHYRIHWQKDDPDAARRPRGSRKRVAAKATCPSPTPSIGFVDRLHRARCCATLPADAPLTADVSADANGTIIDKSSSTAIRTPAARAGAPLRRNDETKPVELRAALRNGTTRHRRHGATRCRPVESRRRTRGGLR